MPFQKATQKKSEKDSSVSSVSRKSFAKNSKSVRELLSPSNAKAQIQFKEPKSANKLTNAKYGIFRKMKGGRK
jgi:hypothetical protein